MCGRGAAVGAGGLPCGRMPRRRRCAVLHAPTDVRAVHSGQDAARTGWAFGAARSAGRGPGHAGADDDGAGPCGRPSGRSGRGRRRLSGKAFRRTRAAGPGTRTGPPPRSCGGLRPSLLRGSYSGHGHTGADRRQRAMHALEKRGGAAGRTDGKRRTNIVPQFFIRPCLGAGRRRRGSQPGQLCTLYPPQAACREQPGDSGHCARRRLRLLDGGTGA